MGIAILEFDRSTPHAGIVIDDATGIASRDTNGGWVTLRSSEPLSAGGTCHFAMRVLDQGDGADGSGLMLGLLPKLSTPQTSAMANKYISELGGWCLSRAGECYGAWKCDRLAFATGSTVEFDVDFAAKVITVVSGREIATGQLPSLAEGEELYAAVSLYYVNQRVVFV